MENFENQMGLKEEICREKISNIKRTYVSPELVKWGSIVDLTLGPDFLFDDVDAGGSEFV